MKRNAKRLLISLVISLACALLTQLWYQSAAQLTVDYGNKQPVAQLLEVINEVHKKPLKRLVWRALSNNESVYAGEMIRTTESSQARILFPLTGTEINLEPDTLIMIGEESGQLSLEFLKGNLYVKGGTNETLKLKSGNNQIAVSSSELSLGKAESGSVQLQVFKGEPNVQGADFQRVKDSFVIQAPEPNTTVHVLPDGKDPVQFQWKALEQDHEYVLEAGKSRSTMKPLELKVIQKNQVSALIPPGDYYWRLIAKPKGDEKSAPVISSVYRLRILPKRPPVALIPAADAQLIHPGLEQKVSMKWANPGQLTDIVLEIAESQDLKANAQVLKGDETNSVDLNLKNNKTYFWRLTGYIPLKKEPVMGPVLKFKTQAPAEFVPPKVIQPVAGANLSFTEASTFGVNMKWSPATGAQSYQIRLKSPDGKEQLIPSSPSPLTQANVRDLKPGEYDWNILSFNGDLKELAATAKVHFKISELQKINWTTQNSDGIQFYYGDKPDFNVAWLPGPKETFLYRVSWRDSKPDSTVQTIEVKTTQAKTQVPSEGIFNVMVEALNKDNLVIAKSSERSITVQLAPLLPPPTFAIDLANPLKAQRSGKLDLAWSSVEGAKEYTIEIHGADGKIVREERSSAAKLLLNKLLPGDYKLTVRGVDQGGRRGIASTERPLIVPNVSDVSAPKMKKIKVE